MDQIVGEKEHAKTGEFPRSFSLLYTWPNLSLLHNVSSLYSLVVYIPSLLTRRSL